MMTRVQQCVVLLAIIVGVACCNFCVLDQANSFCPIGNRPGGNVKPLADEEGFLVAAFVA